MLGNPAMEKDNRHDKGVGHRITSTSEKGPRVGKEQRGERSKSRLWSRKGIQGQ